MRKNYDHERIRRLNDSVDLIKLLPKKFIKQNAYLDY